nr:hypothetical protein [Endozoicomonas sp.]
MATNGESARKWLEENREQVSQERVLQIRNNLIKKTDQIAEAENSDVSDEGSGDEYSGLLEALDVMDSWLQEQTAPVTEETQTEPSALDYSSLIQDSVEPAPRFSQEEKLRRFQSLLKSSKQ